jgi:hypothetical protein
VDQSKLPRAIATYLGAEKSRDGGVLADCFTVDAHVHDESHDYHGLDAIRSWKREAQAKYNYTVEPLDATTVGNTVTVNARLTGDFPGSPIELDYVFTLENGKIASLAID